MKVGAVPGGPLEWLLIKGNQVPIPLIESFSAMMNAKAILAANQLGLFDALAQGPLTPDELAREINVSSRGSTDLTDALCANEYLNREGDRVALSAISRKWLVRSSPHFLGNMLQHVNDLWPIWLNLEEAVRTGKPPATNYQNWLRDDEYRQMLRRHILGLRDVARLTAPELVRAIKLPRFSTRLLDIGGGHGGYSTALCNRHPSLRATVFDLKATAEIGREIVEREGMADRVEFQVGDFLRDDLGSVYDAVLYFNILHNYPEPDNRAVLAKISNALRKGGALAIWDMFKEQSGEPHLQPSLMALHMLVASGGTSYLMDDVVDWMRKAGFGEPKMKRTRTAPGLTLIVARKR
jgi:ubiquinone/menaquinone biosynthesis C-methylase UbiE